MHVQSFYTQENDTDSYRDVLHMTATKQQKKQMKKLFGITIAIAL